MRGQVPWLSFPKHFFTAKLQKIPLLPKKSSGFFCFFNKKSAAILTDGDTQGVKKLNYDETKWERTYVSPRDVTSRYNKRPHVVNVQYLICKLAKTHKLCCISIKFMKNYIVIVKN